MGRELSEKLRLLGIAVADRLAQVSGDPSDLFKRFIDAQDRVPISVLLMDKGLRRSALKLAGEGGRSLARAFQHLQQAAEANEDLAVTHLPRTMVRQAKPKEMPPAVAEAMRLVEAEEAQAREQAEAAAAAQPALSIPEDSPTAAPSALLPAQRNVKGELGHFFAKKMGRGAAKGDINFAAQRVSDHPATFRAQCEIWGRSFESKDAHTTKKAAEHDAALTALDTLLAEAGMKDSGAAAVDWKGQLLSFFQPQGQRDQVQFEIQRVGQEESEEKIFQAKVTLPSGQVLLSEPQSRTVHGCSAKTRRAAEQDVAQKALLALQGKADHQASASQTPMPSAACQPPPRPTDREVQVLWLPAAAHAMPFLRRVVVENDDFLATAESLLKCNNTVCYPLSWQRDRPKGLSLYEAIDASEVVNDRATAIAGVEVFGDSFMMDASAHSSGAELVDITLPRYEFLKAERSGFLREPVPALNHSRGMLVCGHPKFPESFSAETWVGLNPRSLLNDVVRRKGFAQPRTDVILCKDDLPKEAAKGQSWFQGVISLPELGLQVHGAMATNKSEAQQQAAMKMLQRLQQEAESAGAVWQHPLCKSAMAPAVRGVPRPSRKPLPPGSKVICSYQITLVAESDQDGPSIELPLEGQERLTAFVGGNILHPVLEDLLQRLTPAGEAVTVEAPCEYEGNPCKLVMSAQLLSITHPMEPPPEPAKTIKFDPPLWKQRQRYIVQALQARKVSSVLDLGCGDGQLLEALVAVGLQRVLGLDLSEGRIKAASRRLAEKGGDEQHVEVMQADFVNVPAEGEPKWISFAAGVQAIVLCEVLEHLPEVAMPRLPGALFGALQPEVVVVTSPNADFGESSDSEDEDAGPAEPRQFRHADHEREWTREEFREWAEAAAEKHGYWISEFDGVGYLPDQEAQGPCTQLAVFERKDLEEAAEEVEEAAALSGWETQVDLGSVSAKALRSQELDSEGSGLWKHVLREGTGEPPPQHSRVNLHYSTYLIDGRRVDTSREGKRSMPCAFQLGRQDQGVEAWQLAAQTMSCGEVAWLQCPARYAYGSRGAPNIPADADVWFCLELTSTKAPGTVRFLSRVADALEETERHMEVGRADIKRQAFAQARQAFRRAVAAVPDKLLLKQSDAIITRFAKMERASLLNQAHCCLKLGDSVPDVKSEQQAHFREALQACRSLFDRHGPRDVQAEDGSLPESMVQVADAICKASQLEEVPWMAKAHFRRGLAKEKLRYLTDAVADYEAALALEPTDSVISKQLQLAKARKQKAELKPTQMFAGILQRERAEREREEAAADLAARKQRREERLQREAEQRAAQKHAEASET